MAFKDFPEQQQGVQLLQRSLERGRLAHAYLFAGHQLSDLESLARTLAKTLNCQQPRRAGADGPAIDCCDACLGCRKIDHDNHADVFWVRPESKLRQIKIGQLVRRDDSPPRVLLDVVNLKPTEAEYKVSIVVAADRMNEQAANSFLKTLEEPPPKSILILLSTEPQRMLETILSRCLRLNFAGANYQCTSPEQLAWLSGFGDLAAEEQRSLLDRYRLLGVLVKKLNELKAQIEETLTTRSPLTLRRGGKGVARAVGGGTCGGNRSGISASASGPAGGFADVAARCLGAGYRGGRRSAAFPRLEQHGAGGETNFA